jgi:hypothetical protein
MDVRPERSLRSVINAGLARMAGDLDKTMMRPE